MDEQKMRVVEATMEALAALEAQHVEATRVYADLVVQRQAAAEELRTVQLAVLNGPRRPAVAARDLLKTTLAAQAAGARCNDQRRAINILEEQLRGVTTHLAQVMGALS